MHEHGEWPPAGPGDRLTRAGEMPVYMHGVAGGGEAGMHAWGWQEGEKPVCLHGGRGDRHEEEEPALGAGVRTGTVMIRGEG